MAKVQERKVELPGVEPRAFGLLCRFSATELQLPAQQLPAAPPLFLPFCHFKGMNRNGKIGSIMRSRLISLWTRPIGVPTILLPAVILLKIHCNQKSYIVTYFQKQSTMILIKSMWYTIMLTGNMFFLLKHKTENFKIASSVLTNVYCSN